MVILAFISLSCGPSIGKAAKGENNKIITAGLRRMQNCVLNIEAVYLFTFYTGSIKSEIKLII